MCALRVNYYVHRWEAKDCTIGLSQKTALRVKHLRIHALHTHSRLHTVTHPLAISTQSYATHTPTLASFPLPVLPCTHTRAYTPIGHQHTILCNTYTYFSLIPTPSTALHAHLCLHTHWPSAHNLMQHVHLL